jgi:hypothetical protein
VPTEEAPTTETRERQPDPDCEHCEGSGLDPDAYFVNHDTGTWTHAPCSECLPEDEDAPGPAAERVKHSGPDTEFCVLCLSGEHECVTETVHACPPDGAGVTPCCGRTPFELPRTDRMSTDSALVTCRANKAGGA